MVALEDDVGSKPTDSIQLLLDQWASERPDLNVAPLALLGRIQRLSTHLQRRSEEWLQPLGLTWEAFSLIATLRRSGPPYALRPTDIYKASLLTSGTVTNRIDKVEALGLVKRERDANDRRGVVVSLTRQGKTLADRAIEKHVASLEVLFGAMSGSDRGALGALLSTLLAHVETA